MTARSLLAAALLPAGVAAVIWVAGHGTTGVIAAARAGAWADGFRVGAVLVCVLMVTSVGDGRHSRSAAVRRWVTDIPDGVLVTVALICCTVTLLVVVTAPHPTDSFASKADGLGWLPSAARTPADRVRDDIVTTELDALASCLADRSETPWQTDYTNDNPLDEPDVARLIVGGEPTGAPPGDLMTAIIAAHNQLAPWVETIAVQWAGSERVRTDRETLPRRQPLTDPTIVVAATSVGRELLDAVSADRTTALRCSAGPVL